MTEKKQFEQIVITIGSVCNGNGESVPSERKVQFEGRRIARQGYQTGSSRGEELTLYQLPSGRFLLHEENWTNWQGETTTRRLRFISAEDLGPLGQYASLGQECGYDRPLSLSEAFAWQVERWGEEPTA